MIETKKGPITNIRENFFHKYDSYSCPFCSLLPEILNYNEEKNTIKIKCKKHGENTLKIEEYIERMSNWKGASELKYKNKCNIHNEKYVYYCKNCEENMCLKCFKELTKHEKHIKYEINSLRPDDSEISLIKEKIDNCLLKKEELLKTIKKLDIIITFFDAIIYSYEKQSSNYLLNINIKHLLHGENLNFDSIKNSEFIETQSKKEKYNDFIKNNFLKATEGLDKLNLMDKKIGDDLLENLIEGINNSKIYQILLFGGKIQGPNELITLKNIKYINLRGNNISSLNFISGKKFPSLEYLSLNDNEINSIDNLKTVYFPLLSELYLSKNKISNIDVLSELNIKKLRILWLSENNINSIDIFEKVKFPELFKLGLNKNKINNISVFEKNKAKFPQMYELYLNDNEINKDIFFKIIKDLSNRIQEFYC